MVPKTKREKLFPEKVVEVFAGKARARQLFGGKAKARQIAASKSKRAKQHVRKVKDD
jgi:hypothetical protein